MELEELPPRYETPPPYEEASTPQYEEVSVITYEEVSAVTYESEPLLPQYEETASQTVALPDYESCVPGPECTDCSQPHSYHYSCCILAWISCIFFLPFGIIAVVKACQCTKCHDHQKARIYATGVKHWAVASMATSTIIWMMAGIYFHYDKEVPSVGGSPKQLFPNTTVQL